MSTKTNNMSSKRDAEMLPPPYFMHKIWRHAQSRAFAMTVVYAVERMVPH